MEPIQTRIAEREFLFAKAGDTINEVWQRSLPLPSGGSLLPVSRPHLDNMDLMATLGRWRSENQFAYTNRFPITTERTRNWLDRAVVQRPDRILFLVVQRDAEVIGHIGLANGLGREGALEIDNVLRGKKDGAPGLMTEALAAIMEWARKVLFIDRFYLRVLESNTEALDYYRRQGFVEEDRLPLKWHTSDNGERQLEPCTSPEGEDAFVVMTHKAVEHDPHQLILTAGPSIGMRERAYAADAVRTGWNQDWNRYIGRLETKMCERIGVAHAISTSSCTGALHIALAALGIGPGDEVIVPELTWVATANAVRYVGATPVFADVDEKTWLIDTETAARCLTSRTKAIMPVHLYGFPCDLSNLMAFAEQHGLYVIEDAAAALGARHAGRPAGSFGHFSTFSFQGAKVAVSGEGGMLVTNDETLFRAAAKIADQGRKPGTFRIDGQGLKYKMSNMQAAVALAQVERIDELVFAKRRLHGWYREGLAGLRHAEFYAEQAEQQSACWMNSLRLHADAPLTRDALIAALRQRNIDTRPVFPAISQYPIWQESHTPGPVAHAIGESALNLPSGVCLERSAVDYVCRTIRDLLE
ncbi:putative pyridoxal phosphate-dependent aminotransferase EpsN [Azoarcus sp. Aa7]|nr:putative pyridoxal phosphate-dependent aminotransferase EpsN [Azoarcus sp. Aa7]